VPPPPVPGPPSIEQSASALDGVVVPASALPTWPPATSPVPTGYQPRTGAAVLPAPPPPVTAPAPAPPPPVIPQQPTSGTAVNGTAPPEPRWPPAPTSPPPPTSVQYGEWARQQRPAGTVYGAGGPPLDRPAFTGPAGTNPLEVSGSLTGHILAQGRPVEVAGEKSSGSKMVIVTMIIVCVVILVAAGAVVAHLGGVF
jgi:hypothetical protein